ncbi:hypothetical protein DMO17_11745 [Aquipseudomonas alcaligenes]|uniref:30S ribosomal protein S3 n=1 Tax=Aquipseudomonas alcaligenes TaxID=43263 RepID=A0A2V4LES6_AQUAC|nr:hypothetical protein [Pseudomonas alcaligenes]PYC24733.1 hypothetical protein DMO17_11745 [Pseudomonas alcaligenes]
MDYFIVAVTTLAGLYFHGWLYVRIRRWMDRDLALSIAAGDPAMQAHLLEKLAEAKRLGVRRGQLEDWLHQAARDYLQRRD